MAYVCFRNGESAHSGTSFIPMPPWPYSWEGTDADHLSWAVFWEKEISTNIALEFSHSTLCVCVCVCVC